MRTTTKGPRERTRSERYEHRMVPTNATAYGGTVKSCARESVYPNDLMIVGRKPETDPRLRFRPR
jgi:hypothetical protein